MHGGYWNSILLEEEPVAVTEQGSSLFGGKHPGLIEGGGGNGGDDTGL